MSAKYSDGCITSAGIFIYERGVKAKDRTFITIMRHEIGHTLGFDHSSYGFDLMYEGLYKGKNVLKEASEWELKAFKIYYE
jgi:hypothetical protein